MPNLNHAICEIYDMHVEPLPLGHAYFTFSVVNLSKEKGIHNACLTAKLERCVRLSGPF